MRRRILLVLPLLLAACDWATPEREPPPAARYEAAVVPEAPAARRWGDEAADWPSPQALARARWEAGGRPAPGPRLDVLAVSSGGPHGAFAAGLLAGWSEAGDRPEFDVVTGVSVGALIAPFAFAGPEWDAALARLLLDFRLEEVARLEVLPALRGALGLGDPAPLRARLVEHVTEALIARVAEAHGRGRRLLVGTTHLDAGRPMVWDLGAIAARGEARLFREVMLASAAVPGALAPVAIEVEVGGRRYAELHADGGLTRTLLTGGLGAGEGDPDLAATLWAIQNNALVPGYEPVRSSIPAILSRAITTLIRGKGGADLVAAWAEARSVGAEFRLAFLPAGHVGASVDGLDPRTMRALYEEGRAWTRGGAPWLDRPPALLDRRALDPTLAADVR